jgi:hypothetical protein
VIRGKEWKIKFKLKDRNIIVKRKRKMEKRKKFESVSRIRIRGRSRDIWLGPEPESKLSTVLILEFCANTVIMAFSHDSGDTDFIILVRSISSVYGISCFNCSPEVSLIKVETLG